MNERRKREPMFSCEASEACATEVSYCADMLKDWGGTAVCESCYGEMARMDADPWFDLPPFQPYTAGQRLEGGMVAMPEAATDAIFRAWCCTDTDRDLIMPEWLQDTLFPDLAQYFLTVYRAMLDAAKEGEG
jgi:hypothetical protein